MVGKCHQGWTYSNSQCYKPLHGTYTWNEAQTHCRNYGGHLASIQSYQENDFIYKLMGGVATWIGGYKHLTWFWIWDDGVKWSYTNWNAREPSGDGRCLEMFRGWNGRWNDKPCHYKIQAICKMRSYLG